jgi:excisionase family DNA binding protein
MRYTVLPFGQVKEGKRPSWAVRLSNLDTANSQVVHRVRLSWRTVLPKFGRSHILQSAERVNVDFLNILVYFHYFSSSWVYSLDHRLRRSLAMVEQEAWANAEQVAAHLGIQKQSIYRWIDEKGFPAHHIGRLLRFKLSEVDEWVRQGGGNDDSKNDGK